MLTTVEAIQAYSAKKSAIFPSPLRKHHPNNTFSSSLDPPTVLSSARSKTCQHAHWRMRIFRVPGYPSIVLDRSRAIKFNEDHFELDKFLTMSMVKQVFTFPATCSHLFSCKGIHFLALCLNEANLHIVT